MCAAIVQGKDLATPWRGRGFESRWPLQEDGDVDGTATETACKAVAIRTTGFESQRPQQSRCASTRCVLSQPNSSDSLESGPPMRSVPALVRARSGGGSFSSHASVAQR